MKPRAFKAFVLAVCGLAALGCSAAGPYGYSRTYVPLAEEEAALEDSERYDPVMVRRLPQEWRQKTLELFGLVLGRAEGDDGQADVTLSVRRLAARNLCEAGQEESCRVTVGDQELARVHALVRLRKEDAVGKQAVKPRSLLRIVGRLSDQPNEDDGADVLVASYYRHWPSAEYVTEQARSYMRR